MVSEVYNVVEGKCIRCCHCQVDCMALDLPIVLLTECYSDILSHRLLYYKPKHCKEGVQLMTEDVETLEPGEYLNDKIMNFYLK